ncbi:MAG: hypothetical protein NC318_04350 [Blautia sp.]|nr:hypothetical protein [Lachnoclostridium sp.]MCM1210811.1 hypothetical protein [Blautia sp.]
MKDKNQLKHFVILLFGIMALFVCMIGFAILFMSGNRTVQTDSDEALQQQITDYASAQNNKMDENQVLPSIAQEAIVPGGIDSEGQEDASSTESAEPEAISQSANVVTPEEENDVSYSKEYILQEMTPYFADNNLEAIWDLAHLKRYIRLSAELKGTDTYYYQGDVDSDGAPHGVGLAIYEDNTYYYGSWAHGKRSGDGRWYRFYINSPDKVTKNKKYLAHSYAGEWKDDLPNGGGAEHYDVDVSQFDAWERILQNVVGNFTNGLYDGEMYANTIDSIGRTEEWNATVENGVFTLWRDMSSIGECSVWKKKDAEDTYMDIDQSENKNQGLRELFQSDK